VASPTEDSVVVVAVEVQDAQTAKEAFGGDALADSTVINWEYMGYYSLRNSRI